MEGTSKVKNYCDGNTIHRESIYANREMFS